MKNLYHHSRAAARNKARCNYQDSIRHFETEGGGHLPATTDQVARYLVECADRLSVSDLRCQLAALAIWHRDHGLPDPTRSRSFRPAIAECLKQPSLLQPSQNLPIRSHNDAADGFPRSRVQLQAQADPARGGPGGDCEVSSVGCAADGNRDSGGPKIGTQWHLHAKRLLLTTDSEGSNGIRPFM